MPRYLIFKTTNFGSVLESSKSTKQAKNHDIPNNDKALTASTATRHKAIYDENLEALKVTKHAMEPENVIKSLKFTKQAGISDKCIEGVKVENATAVNSKSESSCKKTLQISPKAIKQAANYGMTSNMSKVAEQGMHNDDKASNVKKHKVNNVEILKVSKVTEQAANSENAIRTSKIPKQTGISDIHLKAGKVLAMVIEHAATVVSKSKSSDIKKLQVSSKKGWYQVDDIQMPNSIIEQNPEKYDIETNPTTAAAGRYIGIQQLPSRREPQANQIAVLRLRLALRSVKRLLSGMTDTEKENVYWLLG